MEPPALHDVPLPVGTLSGAVKLWLDADKHRQTFDPPGVGMAGYALATSDLPDRVRLHIDASEEPLAAGAAYPASTLDAFTGNLARPDADGDMRNTIKYRAVADGGPFAPLSEKDEE